jgi:hypothetical protein
MTLAIRLLKMYLTLHIKTKDLLFEVSRCATLNVDMSSLKEVTCVDEWNHIGN